MYQHGTKLAKPQSSIVSRKLKFQRKIKQLQSMMKTIRLNENLKELREKEPILVPENMTAEDFATADDAVITTSSTLTDEEILQKATQTENDEVKEIEDDHEELVAPSICRKLIGNIEKPFSI